MRTSTSAWAAALAIMSIRGPLTTAEAAPARQYEPEHERHYFPKHLRRGGYNHSSPAVESSSSSSSSFDPEFNSADSSSLPPPSTPDNSPSTRRSRSSSSSSQAYDEEALMQSLIDAGQLPETTNAVVTTTLTIAHNAERTATYTLTYTETSSPVPGQYGESAKTKHSVPLTTSSSVAVPVGTAPDSHHKAKNGTKKATISTRGTSTKNILGSLLPTAPSPLGAASSSHARIDSRTYRHHNTTKQSPVYPPSSSIVPHSSMSSSAGILGGLTNSLFGQGTQPTGTKKHQKTPSTHTTSDDQSTQSSEGLLGHLLPTQSGSTGGILPINQPKPTAPSGSSAAPSGSYSSSSDGGFLVGLTTVVPNILGTNKNGPQNTATQTTDSGLLGQVGLTGLPTGSLTLPAQSVLPTGILPGGNQRPKQSDTSTDAGIVGQLTNGVDTLKSQATGLVGTLTNGVDTALTQATGAVGTLTNGVDTALTQATGLVGTLTNGVGTALTQATSLVGTIATDATGLVGTATGLVGTVATDATSLVGTATGLVGTATGLVGTATGLVGSIATDATSLVGTATGLVGTATGLVGTTTGLVGTATNVVGTATGLVGTVTSDVNTLTNTLGVTPPTGGYTITGGGATLTVPIPTSIATSIPITVPSQVTTSTGTGNNGYTITVPSGASSILSSLSSTGESPATATATATGSSYPTSSALTHTTKLTASSSLTNNTTAAVPVPTKSTASQTQTKEAPHTIKPTATDSATSMTFPTTWKFAPTTFSKTSGLSTATASTDTSVTGLPTYMPKLVQPPEGMPSPPLNTTLIQLGFNYGLNYPFVVGEPESAGQIFQYLPQGIAYGLGISVSQVKMNALMPYDTSGDVRYITTLAQAYIPSEFVDTMEMSIHMPLSQIYANPEPPVKSLMSMINPTIPILPGAALDAASSSAWYNLAATATTGPGAGAPIGGDSGSSNHVRPSTLGIGIGAVGGAAAYAAAMVYVARRYRQKRQGHQRASSVHTTGEMSQRSGGMAGFFMSGANGMNGTGSGGRGSRASGNSSNGRSVREQGISGPIMAENSLGWN